MYRNNTSSNLNKSTNSYLNENGAGIALCDQTVKQKEYYKLIICIQTGLFIVDENQMYRLDEMKDLKKKWEQISRKGFKGYNFKDF